MNVYLEKVFDLKSGENHHLKAEILNVDSMRNSVGRDIYSPKMDLGAKARKPGWTNIGDISACLRTSIGLGEIYKDTETPHIAVASKHTRPVVIAKGKTQYEAVVRAIAGDLNSPFGGFWAFNTPLDADTAKFLDKMFFEGVIAPEYEKGTAELLKDTTKISAHKNRFLIQTGIIAPEELSTFGYSLQPVVFGKFLKQEYEKPFNAKEECAVVIGNNGNTDINSLDAKLIDDIEFAGNAALYLSSNLVFFVHDGAIAGLGDGCGARTVAAEKARRMLEVSAYAALSAGEDELWERVLYDTPFTREEFEKIIKQPIRLTAFSDAFYPKADGFVETAGLDRIRVEFQSGEIEIKGKPFLPKRYNFISKYDRSLIPDVVVQPGGSLGDKVVIPLAEEYNIKMVFTMDKETFEKYQEKGPGKGITGRRFFGHDIK